MELFQQKCGNLRNLGEQPGEEDRAHGEADGEMGVLHVLTDAGGGYRVMMPDTGQALRAGHLFDFTHPGFRVRTTIEIDVMDPEVFREHFDLEPGKAARDEALSKFLAMDSDVEDHIKIVSAQLWSAGVEGGSDIERFLLEIEASTQDEAAFMTALRTVFTETWGGSDGFPTTREGAVFEACLASNANPSPDTCGFLINDWYPPREPAPEPEGAAAPSGLSF